MLQRSYLAGKLNVRLVAMSNSGTKADGDGKELGVEGWDFMQTLGEGAYGE